MDIQESYWVIQGIVEVRIFDYTLLLYGKKNKEEETSFEGKLTFGDEGLNVRRLSSLFLEQTFHLQLPSFLPELVLNTLFLSLSPDKHEFSATANATLDIHNPFGTSDSGLKFEDLQIKWATRNKISVTARAACHGGKGFWPVGRVFFFFGNNHYAFGMAFEMGFWKMSDLFSIISDTTLPRSIADLLPVISPASEQKPIQIYKSNADWEEDGQHWKQGFNISNVAFTLFSHYSFSLDIRIQDRQLYLVARALPFTIFNLVRISHNSEQADTEWGASLSADTNSGTIDISAGFYFFPDANTTTCINANLVYQVNEKAFITRLTLPDSSLKIGFAWSEKNGFRISEMPASFLNELSDAMKWGEQIKKYCNQPGSSACNKFAKISDLKTPKLDTNFELEYNTVDSGQKNVFALCISGTCSIKAKNSVLNNIDIYPFQLRISYPDKPMLEELPKCILNALKDNVYLIAKGLWDNKELLAEFIGLFLLNKAGEEIRRLFCNLGEKYLKKLLRKLIDAAIKELEEKSMETLAEAAAAFAGAAGILTFSSWLIYLSESDRKKKEKAEKAKRDAEEKIKEWLHINSSRAAYIDDSKGLQLIWDAPSAPMTNKVLFVISITFSSSGKVLNLTVSRDKKQKEYSAFIPRAELVHPTTATVTVEAHYKAEDTDFKGNTSVCDNVVIPGGIGYDEIEMDFIIN